ncbi:hypothetical protein, partial [Phytobacter massiliensis]|uniref:hypothetical protein n=1 Tax=Phytobacter massiliensis TaxID=1485952 RepID=UPI001CA31686
YAHDQLLPLLLLLLQILTHLLFFRPGFLLWRECRRRCCMEWGETDNMTVVTILSEKSFLSRMVVGQSLCKGLL